ncbi:MAG: PAS domain S-box protein, partial [Candidatus Thermoplasmatota archaeon]|nr:PAS domain S-box protein [Candidatus Thermoplasmatota archaeon]
MTEEPDIVRQLRSEERRELLQNSAETICEHNRAPHESECALETVDDATESLIQTLESDVNGEEKTTKYDQDEIFKSIFHNVNDVIVYVNSHGKFLLVNDRVKEVFGYEPAEFIGKSVFRCGIFKLTHIPRMIKLFSEINSRGDIIDNTGKRLNIMELEVRKKDRSMAMVEVSSTVLKKDGKTLGYVCILRDVTLKKKAEQLLEESEKKYRLLFEIAPDGIVVIDKTGVILTCNEAITKIYGYTREDIIGKKFTELPISRTNDKSLFIKIFHQILFGTGAKQYDLEIVHKDGSLRQVEVYVDVFKVKNSVDGIIIVAHDVTEQKYIVKELKKTEEKFRELTQLLPESIFEMTIDGKITFVNATGLALFGYTKEDLDKGLYATDIIVPEQHAILQKGIAEAIANPALAIPYDYTVVTKSGQRLSVLINTNIIFDDKNTPVGLRGILINISERKKIEEEIKKSELRFRELAELLPESVFEMTLDGQFTYVNSAALRISGYTLDEALHGLNALQLILPADQPRVRENLGKILQGFRTGPNEYTAVRKNGELFSVLINTNLVLDESKKPVGFRGIITDITERKKEEQAIIESEQRYRMLVDNTEFPVVVTSVADGRILFYNQKAKLFFKIASDDPSSIKAQEFWVHPEERNRFLTLLQQNKHVSSYECELQSLSGDPRWVLVSANIITYEKQQAFFLVYNDITERKKIEQALQESQRRLADVIEFLPDATMAIDLDGKVIAWNRAMEKMTSIAARDILGKGNYEYSLSFYGERRPILIDLALHWDDEAQKKYATI